MRLLQRTEKLNYNQSKQLVKTYLHRKEEAKVNHGKTAMLWLNINIEMSNK